MRILISGFFLLVIVAHAETHPLQKLMEAAKSNSPALKHLLPETLSGLNQRGASAVWGHDFLFAVETEKTASVSIDRQPPAPMKRVPASNL